MKNEYLSTEEKIRGVIRKSYDSDLEAANELFSRKALSVHVGEKAHKVFLTYGFYYHRNDFSTYHSHSSYHEVIIVIGNCELIAGDEILKLEGANIVVMPPKMYHKMLTVENVQVCTFFIDANVPLTVKALPEEIARSFFKETERVYETDDYSIVVPYISLIISFFTADSSVLEPEQVNDYAFLIDTFFNSHYADDISLETLANYLHVSVTHAHRLVQKHTGVTFTEALATRRLKVANYLVKCRNMTLTEAAEAVGFGSYTTFWKARTKYKEKL